MKRLLTLAVAVLAVNFALISTAAAGTDGEKNAVRAQKLKAQIIKLGVGEKARVHVKTVNGTKLSGYVSEIRDSSFFVVSDGTKVATEVPYVNARQVKGHNLSTGVKIAIGVVIALVILSLIGMAAD